MPAKAAWKLPHWKTPRSWTLNTRTILWNKINLGTTVTEIKVPATFRYHIDLSAEWKIEVRDQQCIVIAPMLCLPLPLPFTPIKLRNVQRTAGAFNADEQMDGPCNPSHPA